MRSFVESIIRSPCYTELDHESPPCERVYNIFLGFPPWQPVLTAFRRRVSLEKEKEKKKTHELAASDISLRKRGNCCP